jgi:hypothetical protein
MGRGISTGFQTFCQSSRLGKGGEYQGNPWAADMYIISPHKETYSRLGRVWSVTFRLLGAEKVYGTFVTVYAVTSTGFLAASQLTK